jgi:hypothetical protein
MEQQRPRVARYLLNQLSLKLVAIDSP